MTSVMISNTPPPVPPPSRQLHSNLLSLHTTVAEYLYLQSCCDWFSQQLKFVKSDKNREKPTSIGSKIKRMLLGFLWHKGLEFRRHDLDDATVVGQAETLAQHLPHEHGFRGERVEREAVRPLVPRPVELELRQVVREPVDEAENVRLRMSVVN